MAEADRTTPQTIRKRLKRKPAPKKSYTLPKTHKTEVVTDRRPKPKAGPPSPQSTGRPVTKQPIRRKRDAPPSTTDRTSDAKRTPQQKARDRQVVDQNVREARRAVLRRRGKGAIVHQAKKELEGRGLLAKGLSKVADQTEKAAVLQGTGGGPGGVVASQKLTGHKLGPGAATALAPKPIRVKGTAAGRALKDFVNFPAQALPSVYVPAAGVVEAAKGRPERIKKFVEDVKQTDPIYNTAAAGVEAVRGNSKAAKSHLRKAGKAVSEHPGFTALELYGAKGAVGRGAGAVARSGAVGEGAKRAASTERAARTVPGTQIREERTHSRDVITKGAVVAKDKAKRRSARRLRAKADEAPPERARELRDKAARKDPARLSEHEIKRQVDERVAVNEDLRRAHRAKTASEARQVVRKAKRGGAATAVVAQRIARADKTDLQAYVRELEGQFDGLSNSGKRANKTLRRELQKVIDDPKADLASVESAAVEYRKLIDPLEKKLVKRGLLGEGQEAKAKLIPYAVRHMGAKHDDKPRAPREMAERHELAKEAAKAENRNASEARATLRRTQTVASRAQRLEQVDAPKHRVRVRQTGVKAPFEIRLPRRALTEKERASVDERLTEFQQASRQAVKIGKGAAGEREKLARKADVQARKAKPKKYVPGIVGPDGEPLTVEAIESHMKAHGVDEPAFITQAPNARGARNFNVRSEKPPSISTARRTGEATRKGTFDADPETLVEGAARAQGLVDATDGFRRTVKDMAARDLETKKLRKFKTYREAQRAGQDLIHDHTGEPVPGAVALRPVRLNPFGAKKEQLDKLLEDVDSLDQPQAQALVDSMREGLSATEGKGPWALIPEAAADRLLEHLNTQGGGGGIKTLQLANQTFRKTVLATSTSWLAGNVIEGLGRAALAKAGPGSYLRGKGALRELGRIDPKAAEEAAHRMIGGGHFASAEKLHVRRGAEQFEGTRLAPLATALGKFWRTPGPKQAAQFWNSWTEFVFHTVNGRLESKIQTAMLGRALQTSGLKAIEDAAKGLKETPAQVRFGREVDRMYGRYSKLAPYERRLITTYTPFIAWAGNAFFFVTRVLPRDHPVATALIASAEQATDEWRKSEGLDIFAQGALPGFLQGSVPTGKGGHQRISRYTPFGAFGDPTDTAASQVLPLASGVISAFKGLDWKGNELRVKGDDGKLRPANPIERTVLAAQSFVEATIPVYSQAKRIREQGPRALDPFRDVKPKAAAKKKLRIYKSAARSSGSSSSSSPSDGSFFGGSSSGSGSSGSSSSSGGSFFSP